MSNSLNESPVLLLVEDDLILSRLYEEKFKIEGFSVLVASDAEKGLQIAQDEKLDFILLDVGLPRTSGLDLLNTLRKDTKTKATPAIVLTNQVDPKDRDKALRLGAKEYLVKAMQTPEEVVNKVREHLK